MDNQEFFDKTVEHLRSQGCKSLDEHGNLCKYRAGTLKCAIGGHIPEDIYDVRFEYKPIPELCYDEPSIAKLFNGVTMDLMVWMQNIHDAYKVEEWESKFKYVAELFGLVYTPPKSIV